MTPYTGGNLGDWAIQEAAIANIKERHPDASLTLVTMLPGLTSTLHGVPSVPIGRSGQWQSEPVPTTDAPEDGIDQTLVVTKKSVFGRVKEAVKSTPGMYAVLKPVHGALWPVYGELLHIGRVYRFLRSVDLLIVSGGGQLDEYWGGPWDHPYALFKWGLLAKLTGSRFVVLSVGTCDLQSKVSVFFIRRALRLASYRSYRDRTSKELLKHLRFTQNDEVYPDLAFSYPNSAVFESPAQEHDRKVVGVSPIAYLGPGWPKQDSAVFQPYFVALVAFVRTLIKRGYSVVLFSTDGPDRAIVRDMVDVLSNEKGLDVSGKLSHPRTHTLPELFAQLRQVDYVVASRLHGVLLSHRFCLPVLAISYDRKVDTYMEDLGLSEHCVDIHDIATDSLVEAFEALTEQSRSIRSTLRDINDRCARDLQRQYDVVLAQGENREAS
ncbi:MAG: polysaccharide pyruvyl transferase family protein [Polyangiales bacterium]|jgi:polysaccharide pyruvyl transferase WcaK-like protein